LSPVMRASWTVMHNRTPKPLVLNDRGLAAFLNIDGSAEYGLPISPHLLLLLGRGTPPALDYDGVRVTGIRHAEMHPEDVDRANRSAFRFALGEVYGPSHVSLTTL